MTNQGNVSTPQNDWQHGYNRGVEDQKKKTKKVKKCLRKERQRTEKLEDALKKAGLPLPDPYLGKLARIGSFFARRWRSMLTVVLITLTLALLAIAFWPHDHDGNLRLKPHWHDPFKVLDNGNASKA